MNNKEIFLYQEEKVKRKLPINLTQKDRKLFEKVSGKIIKKVDVLSNGVFFKNGIISVQKF